MNPTKLAFPFSGITVLLFLHLLVMVAIPPSAFSHSGGVEFLQNLQGCGKGDTLKGVNQLKQYLRRYGHLHYSDNHAAAHANDNEFDELLESAVKSYQRYYHLNASGGLDTQTVNQMMKPRCGVPDIVHATTRMQSGRKKNKSKQRRPLSLHIVSHYSFFNITPTPRWPPNQTHLTYKFLSVVEGVTLDTLRPVISRAFAKWAAVSNFTFEEAQPGTQAKLEIGFEKGIHSDEADFDGPGGTIAHAAAPTHGFFHYDADDKWSTNPNKNEFDLETIAIHEIGHMLGLDHSEDEAAVMYPYFSYGEVKRQLSEDDVKGIHALYNLPN